MENEKAFATLQKRLNKNSKILRSSFRGDRTFVVIPGLNHPKNVNLTNVKGLKYYEERMFFFLFLLKYKRTKIVYVTTKGFDTNLFNYYVGLISDDDDDLKEKLKNLVHIEVDDDRNIALVKKVLESPKTLRRISKEITDHSKTVLRCYNPTELERKLAVKLMIPLFGSDQKFDFAGTKSGGRKIFKSSKVNIIPGFEELKNFQELTLAMAKLLKKYPTYKKLMVKRNYASSGKGNCVFKAYDFLEENNLDILKIDLENLTKSIRKEFRNYVSFQKPDETFEEYKTKFNVSGGIVELFVPGINKYSPSTQVQISSNHKARIISTHEQILGGADGQVYLGCTFPALPSHRKLIIKEGEKIAQYLAKKGIIGNFAIDYVVVYDKSGKNPIVYPIEINLRKGGTTHPFRTAYFLTGAKYKPASGILACGKTPIHYRSMDFIESEKYKNFSPSQMVDLVSESKISFNKNTKKGVLVFMPGMLPEYGRFGAVCIGHSRDEAELYYKKLLRLVGNNSKK